MSTCLYLEKHKGGGGKVKLVVVLTYDTGRSDTILKEGCQVKI